MDKGVQIAIISAAASIVVAALSFVFNTRQKRQDEIQQRKVKHYQELLSALSDLAVHGLNDDTNARYATAFNTIALIAPQRVIEALSEFQDEIKMSNQNKSHQRHDELLTKLLLEIRHSLELPFDDNPSTFRFRLIGSERTSRD
jgi:hypothetical protein